MVTFIKIINIAGILLWCYACLFAKKHQGKLAFLSLLLMAIR